MKSAAMPVSLPKDNMLICYVKVRQEHEAGCFTDSERTRVPAHIYNSCIVVLYVMPTSTSVGA